MLLLGSDSYKHTHTVKVRNKIGRGPRRGSTPHFGQKIITKCPPRTHTHTHTHTTPCSTHAQDRLFFIEYLGPLAIIKFRYDLKNVLFYWRVTHSR